MDLVRSVGVVLGVGADRIFGDPRRGHPVAGFGQAASALERRLYRDNRLAGSVFTALAVGVPVGAGVLVERGLRERPVLRCLTTAALTWVTVGFRSLAGHGAALADELDAGDVAAARRRLPSLCGRDPDLLDEAGLTRAATESIAENTSDAATGPLVWGALAGIPGLLGYRAVNTLDAMVGYPSSRYRRFGWASARLDDVANVVPARLSAVLVAAAAGTVGGSTAGSLETWRRDAAAHPSPNAGQVEAAFAGALGICLGGPTRYRHGTEIRPRLGDGPAPDPADLRRAVRLSGRVVAGAVAVAALVAAAAV